MTGAHDLLPMGEVSRRSGFAASAIRYYEAEGLFEAHRSTGGQRQFERSVLRRLAFIRAASNVGLTIEEIRDELGPLPGNRTPTKADWQRISRHWGRRLDEQIAALQRLKGGLDGCIGCGCLSLRELRLLQPRRRARRARGGLQLLPDTLRQPHPTRRTSRVVMVMIIPMTDGYEIRAGPDAMDLDLVHRLAQHRRLLGARPHPATTSTAPPQARSLNFGAFADGNRQVAYARVVADHANFAWLCDVYVDRDHRGRGLGGRLVAAAAEQLDDVEMPATLLSTYDAHTVCAGAGFTPLPEPDRWMVRQAT